MLLKKLFTEVSGGLQEVLPGVCILGSFWVLLTWSFRHASQKLKTLCTLHSPVLSLSLSRFRSVPQTVWNAEKPEPMPVKLNPFCFFFFSSLPFCYRALNNSHPSLLRLSLSTGRRRSAAEATWFTELGNSGFFSVPRGSMVAVCISVLRSDFFSKKESISKSALL